MEEILVKIKHNLDQNYLTDAELNKVLKFVDKTIDKRKLKTCKDCNEALTRANHMPSYYKRCNACHRKWYKSSYQKKKANKKVQEDVNPEVKPEGEVVIVPEILEPIKNEV